MLRFLNNFEGYTETLSLGDDFIVWDSRIRQNCRFIKVTRKGFNILDLDTSRVILKKHLYMRGMGNKEYPCSGLIRGKFLIPAWIRIQKKPQEQEKTS